VVAKIVAGDQVLPCSATRIQLIAYLNLKLGSSFEEREKDAPGNLAPEFQERIGFGMMAI
jgi:hypothetical protein